MRAHIWLVRMGLALLPLPTLPNSVAAASIAPAVGASSSAIAGTWKGPYLGYTFTFEFKQESNGWTGRYQSDKTNKWFNLRDIQVTDGAVQFSIVSQPPSVYKLKLDPGGKLLIGSVQIGQYPAIPLDLSRAS